MWCWEQGKHHGTGQSHLDLYSEFVESDRFYKIDQETFYYAKTEVDEENSSDLWNFNKVKINFAGFEVDTSYSFDRSLGLDVKSFGFDTSRTILILLYYSIKKKREVHLRMIDINDNNDNENETLYDIRVKNKELIGRLESRLYALVDGHIYYND